MGKSHVRDVYKGEANFPTSTFAIIVLLCTPSILRYKLFKYVYQAHVRDVYKGGTNIHTSTYAIIILLYTPSILRDKLFKDVYQELKIMLNNVRLRIKMNQIIKLPFLNHILLL